MQMISDTTKIPAEAALSASAPNRQTLVADERRFGYPSALAERCAR
jgi:hypothetical protein